MGAPSRKEPALFSSDLSLFAPGDHPLVRLGYTQYWRVLFDSYAGEGLLPGRVARSDRGSCLVAWAGGLGRAQPSVRLRKAAGSAVDLPAAGDWVALRDGAEAQVDEIMLIEAVLPRRTAFIRSDPGNETAGQVLAANIDVVFVVHALGAEPNLRRIERELAVAWESGAQPVIALTKADLASDPDADVATVSAVASGVDVLSVSVPTSRGVQSLLSYCSGNRTVALIGPSGSGKSTLINAMIGEDRQATREVRVGDGKGRHTTVARELVPVPGGGVLVDTPGLRALALWDADHGISRVFGDIEELARSCRFVDCTHLREPGCALVAAVERGEVPAERLLSYQKLAQESARVSILRDARRRAEAKGKGKGISKAARALYRLRGR